MEQFAVSLVKKYKYQLVNILVIIFTFILLVNMFQSQTRKLSSIKGAKDMEYKKNEVLASISKMESKIVALQNRFNLKDPSFVINTISTIAKQSNIKISAIKPKKEENLQAYVRHPFELTMNVDGYHTIARFIARLENYSDVSFYVDNASFTPEPPREGERAGGLTVNLTISTVVFQN